ncbi:MAG: hypothetical protein GYB20_00130 [Oceanospirillales bacterium]|nr:hypothetical protein [Oceanospirillales bacterium]MBR9886093.1 hypothetical protein [Oceanospirillales bacterium]
MIRTLIKDPLLHFMLLGVCLFGVYNLTGSEEKQLDKNTIVVDRDALLTFMQYRARQFNAKDASQRLDSMSGDEREQLIHDFVREEALYREAQALGMSDNDYIIRRRSVQKLEFIAQGVAEQTVSMAADKVETYFNDHRQDYYEEASYTFTHVFIKNDPGDSDAARQRAADLLQQLNGQQVEFSAATRFGDRFLYHRNYVERTPDFIASHFGDAFRNQLSQMKPDRHQWQGPVTSAYGQHLVMLSNYTPGKVPEFTDIRSRVEQDYRIWQQRQKQELAIQQIVEQYHVEKHL